MDGVLLVRYFGSYSQLALKAKGLAIGWVCRFTKSSLHDAVRDAHGRTGSLVIGYLRRLGVTVVTR